MLKGKAEAPTGSETKFSECYLTNLKSPKAKKEEKETNFHGRALRGTIFGNIE